MRKLRAVAQRHPRVVDAMFATILAALLARVTADFGSTSGLEWMWFAGLFAPLVWRRRWPMVVYWVVIGVAFAAVSFGATGPALLIMPMVAVYTVARYRPRRDLLPAVFPVIPFTAGWLWYGGPLWDALTLTAFFAASILLGMYLQTRRAYLAELEERARRLEREREQQAQHAIATERARIAREVHNIVAHNLAVMVALADGAVASTPVSPQRGVDMMEKVSMTGREALTEIRRLVGLLRDGESESQPDDPGGRPSPQPGLDDIDGLIAQARAAGLKVHLSRDGTPGTWGPGAGLAVYRIVQEALTNTIKHAGPMAKADVRLRYDTTGADVEVIDDGGLYPAGQVNGGQAVGHGLTGMAERAASFDGRLEAGPCPGRGWRIHAYLAFDKSSAR